MQQRRLIVEDHDLSILTLNEDQRNPPIVFLHGITLTADFWLPTLPNALKAMPCYFITLPAHYPSCRLSSANAMQMTSEKLVTILQKAIQALVGDRAVAIVGYSTGGFAALSLAAHSPTQVSRILCIAGFAKGQWQGLMRGLQQLCCMGDLGLLVFKLVCGLSMLNPVVYRWMSGQFAGDRFAYFHTASLQSTVAALYPHIIHHSLDDLAALFRSFAATDISTLLPHIQAPTLILAGDRDPVVALSQTQMLANTIPNAELRILPGMGHMFFAERLAEYQQILTCWATQVSIAL